MLAALAGGEPMTAGQVAEKAALARNTVSTTLSKLAKSGEVEKAERGYRLAAAGGSTEAPAHTSGEAASSEPIAVATGTPTGTASGEPEDVPTKSGTPRE